MKKKLLGGGLFTLLLVAVICLFSSVYTVAENEYACIIRFSKIISTTDQAGIHIKVPFLDSVRVFPKAMMFYDIKPSELLTSDKQNMTVDSYVLWNIIDPLTFYRTLGSLSVAEQRLDALTYNALKNTMGTLAQRDIINEETPRAGIKFTTASPRALPRLPPTTASPSWTSKLSASICRRQTCRRSIPV
jgi:membrane protease subunit HflC